MGIEIERKFLVTNESWKEKTKGILYRQGYLNSEKTRTVRVRTIEEKGFLTIKGISIGAKRAEYEYEIPLADAIALLKMCEKPIISKHRHKLDFEGMVWEIDEFHGENEGLIIAEIELESETQAFAFPEWLGQEVTHDIKYFNSNLIKNPFSKWQK
ncbi:MAG: CYTH domain-containing protein [Chitinophagales bacterium]